MRRRYKGQCRVTDCDTLVHCRALCGAHYRRWRLYGSPTGGKQVRKQSPVCIVPGCTRKPKSLDRCNAHRLRLYRHGDVLADKPIRYRKTLKQMSQ